MPTDVLSTPPTLHGDGVTDDTDAMQWYLDRDLEPPRPAASWKLDHARLRVPKGVGFGSMEGDSYVSRSAPSE